jgi:uncharacterized membrane protein YphA (DoxX/SURF4 family)
LIDPQGWTVFVPEFLQDSFIPSVTIILLNGWMEVIGAALLIAGFWMRPVALVLGIHMLLIAIETGGAIGVRDFGLTVACIALALSLPDRWTLDHKLEAQPSTSTPKTF